MTRATRSSATQEKEKHVETPPAPRKTASKKRKRTSAADTSEQPVNKLARTKDGIKEEASQEPEEQPLEAISKPELQSSGDVPILPEDAEQILEVLEMIDTQGLLDRIFPLPTEHTSDSGSSAGPSTGTQSYSFRALLKAPSQFPLRILRSAVQHLFPISSHPRSRPSAPAAEQLRFCQLALSLLDQASLHSAPIPLDAESLIPDSRVSDVEESETLNSGSYAANSALSRRKYALLQRLPNGDWWSSLNSSYPTLAADGKALKELPTSYAELVAVLPSSSTSTTEPLTLGHYIKKKSFKPMPTPQQRRLACGTFLDYGPYVSFAPTFEQNGKEVGRARLGEVIWFTERDQRRRAKANACRKQLMTRVAQANAESGRQDDEIVDCDWAMSKQMEQLSDLDLNSLESLLTPDQVINIKSVAKSLELEDAVSELLERNARALERLEILQLERLVSAEEGAKNVQVGSEEWDTAQGILDSLTLLASLRPRASDLESAPLIPPASVLRKLHRTLPLDSMQGWSGTLPETRATACRDDMTVKARPGASVVAPTPVPQSTPSTPAAPPTPAAAKPPTTTYSNYSYSTYTTPYRGAYGTYTPQTSTNYYPNYQAAVAPTTQTSTASHYPNQQYSSSTQQPYSAYSSWYNYQPPASTAVTGSAAPSTQATPQTVSKLAGNYVGGYYSNTQQPQPQRAVANTVLTAGSAASKTFTAGAWSNGTAYMAPTLPPHMRSTVSSTPSAPGTPPPVSATASGSTSYSSHYGNYQPPPTPTPAAAQ